MLARCHQDDLLGIQNGANPHRNGFSGHVLVPEKIAGRILACNLIKDDATRPGLGAGPGVVESDVTRATDPEQDHVQSASCCNLLLVGITIGPDFFSLQVSSGNMDILPRDIHVVEEVLPHEPMIALQRIRLHGIVFVQVERGDVREIEAFFLVHQDQMLVYPDGRATSWKSQNNVLIGCSPFPDQVCDASRHIGGHLRGRVENFDGNLLPPGSFRRAAPGRPVTCCV